MTSPAPTRVLGFDPSKSSCGWAVFDGSLVASGAQKCTHRQTSGVTGIEAAYSGAVASWAREVAKAIVSDFDPIAAVFIEEPLQQRPRMRGDGKPTMNTNGLTVHMSAAVFSALAGVAVKRGIRVWSAPQQTWRKGIGVRAGSSDQNKAEAMRVARLTGADPKTHDEAEAICIAQWGFYQINRDRAVEALPLMRMAR